MTIDFGLATAGAGLALVAVATVIDQFERRRRTAALPVDWGRGGKLRDSSSSIGDPKTQPGIHLKDSSKTIQKLIGNPSWDEPKIDGGSTELDPGAVSEPVPVVVTPVSRPPTSLNPDPTPSVGRVTNDVLPRPIDERTDAPVTAEGDTTKVMPPTLPPAIELVQKDPPSNDALPDTDHPDPIKGVPPPLAVPIPSTVHRTLRGHYFVIHGLRANSETRK